MKHTVRTLAYITVALLSASTQAQIYEAKDAEGHPVFTDSPAPGAVEVDLPESNIADSVKPSAMDAEAPDVMPATPEAHKQHGNIVVPETNNERLEQERNSDMPHEVLEADLRHEVGDNVTPEEARRREEAREGVIVDEQGNVEVFEHRGHR